jgi:pSer/pThr/pTyr-binding forkhead associated (FHA) protein
MARLFVKTAGMENQLIELKLGANRIGRSPDADFTIAHPTVSGLHCELVLLEEGVTVRDLESTNGTFVDGRQVRESTVSAGQVLRLGDVELLMESTEVRVAIPKFVDTGLPAPPVVLTDGSMLCPRHPQAHVTHRCTHCREVMCESCVHCLQRKGSRTILFLCPICSHTVEPVEPMRGVPKPKKKSLLVRVGETVKMKLTRAIHLSGNNR